MPILNKISNKYIQEIKIIEIIHIVSNFLSGGLLGVICIGGYLLLNKQVSPEIRDICYDIINFNLSFIIYTTLGFISILLLIGIILIPIIYAVWIVLLVLGAVKHLAGERYVYPLTITFIK
ncbi:DUF4870 domain-containing protein [Candidatus Gracilibacteria bacterium]|nr:DUF4870 domain-containing protein [Candidatus Gracilibacteria bacterium]